MEIENRLTRIFQEKGAGPFLFVGSGFSRRYLGLEDWKGLLSKFCVAGKPFEYYLATADGDFPAAAKLLAYDFNEYWWKAPEYAHSVDRYKSKVVDSTSALRIEISAYLSNLGEIIVKDSPYVDEISLLSSLNVDGIITTNWDQFLELLFPDYKRYIGQNELLFSNPQEIGEIYKIHGCSSRPNSLILTSDDYTNFNEKNPYLAAKLITVFVEHPIVFLGYSISDPNIGSLLRSISLCVGRDNIEKLRQNLIFVDRLGEEEKPNISDTFLMIDGVQIPLVLVKTNDYSEVYRALSATKRKIPARVLRYCKEQLYELVKSLEPEKKLCVLDIDAIEEKEDVEFLVGVGVANKVMHEAAEIAEIGYEIIEIDELINDVLQAGGNLDAARILASVIPRACKKTKYVPIFKYLHEVGIANREQYDQSHYNFDKLVDLDLKDFRIKQYASTFFKRRTHGIEEIIKECTAEVACALIPFLPREKINTDVLHAFILANLDNLDYKKSNYASYFRKLVVIYDRLRWGW